MRLSINDGLRIRERLRIGEDVREIAVDYDMHFLIFCLRFVFGKTMISMSRKNSRLFKKLKLESIAIIAAKRKSGEYRPKQYCERCFSSNSRLHNHHYHYANPDLVIVLCNPCHKFAHKNDCRCDQIGGKENIDKLFPQPRLTTKPPKISLKNAKKFGISEQYMSKINTGARQPSLKLSCLLAKFVRDMGNVNVCISQWRPDLIEPEIYSELLRAVRSQTTKPKEFPG